MTRVLAILFAVLAGLLLFGKTCYGQTGHFEKRCDAWGSNCRDVWVPTFTLPAQGELMLVSTAKQTPPPAVAKADCACGAACPCKTQPQRMPLANGPTFAYPPPAVMSEPQATRFPVRFLFAGLRDRFEARREHRQQRRGCH